VVVETERLAAVLERHLAGAANVPGIVAAISSPSRGVEWRDAAGWADPAARTPLTTTHAFRIASNTKTFVAAAVLRLMEEGALGLDDPLTAHLGRESLLLLRAGGYDPAAIALRHLLWHNSGLFDHTNAPVYVEWVLGEPAKRWNRWEQLQIGMEHGTPLGRPGERWSYSDTGYVLLGEVLERAGGVSWAQSLRALLPFERIGLGVTWLESLEHEPPDAPPRAHQFYGDIDVFDGEPSWDLWGGGGLVSTVSDLIRFYRALLGGEVFRRPETLATMLEIPPSNAAEGCAMGLFRSPLLPQHQAWSHAGYWGTIAMASIDAGVAIALSYGQAKPEGFDPHALLTELLAIAVPDLSG
jgi:D-alanyl-D-alanine carboxypeptidase